MKDKIFVDTNIVVYVFDKNAEKKIKAIEIIEKKPYISSQVIIESLNVCTKKLKLSKEDSITNAEFLIQNCHYSEIKPTTFLKAFEVSNICRYSHLDSLIIATALEANCHILYSEDLQHGQLIDKKLKIINPFL